MPFKSHDEYFAAQAANIRDRLAMIQQEVERQVPGSTRTIRYNLPAFRKDKTFFYFAAFRKHIGIYPPVTDDPDIIQETSLLRGPKGNLSFSHDVELPLELVGRVAKALASQYGTAYRPQRSLPAVDGLPGVGVPSALRNEPRRCDPDHQGPP